MPHRLLCPNSRNPSAKADIEEGDLRQKKGQAPNCNSLLRKTHWSVRKCGGSHKALGELGLLLVSAKRRPGREPAPIREKKK
jgi:hypothetical protein